ncbi:MAG: hypothetical protein ACR5LD_01365 [Symbiopectobacterium sp.]
MVCCFLLPFSDHAHGTLPTGIIYAISGLELELYLISTVNWLFYGQKLDLPAILWIFLIILGIILTNLFSKSVGSLRRYLG